MHSSHWNQIMLILFFPPGHVPVLGVFLLTVPVDLLSGLPGLSPVVVEPAEAVLQVGLLGELLESLPLRLCGLELRLGLVLGLRLAGWLRLVLHATGHYQPG